MSKLTKQKYQTQKANCDGLCDINEKLIDESRPDLLPCVTCPFCKEIVTAELTHATIHCPACKITVKR